MNRNKVICKCRRLTKGDVADAVEQGAVSFRQVKKATRAGDACGHCKKLSLIHISEPTRPY